MKSFYEENKALIMKIMVLAGLLVFAYLLVNYLFSYIAPFVAGFVISLMLNPFVGLLQRRFKINRSVGTLVVLVLYIVLVFVLGDLLVGNIVEQAKSFISAMPSYLNEAQRLFDNLRDSLDNLSDLIPMDIEFNLDSLANSLVSLMTPILQSGVKEGGMVVVTSLPGIVMSVLLSLISAYFFTKDKKLIENSLSGIVPMWLSDNAKRIKSALIKALGGYIKAQLIVMSVVASICILGLTILRNPYSLLIGLAVGVIDALPVFGLGSIFWPWILYNLLVGDYRQAISLAIIYVVAFLARQTLEPKVVGEHIGVHPLITLMSIYIGLKVFGVLGIFLGPILVITMKVMLEGGVDKQSSGAITD